MVVAGVLDAGGVVFINLGSPSLFISGTYVLLPDRSRTGLGFASSSPISLLVLASAGGSCVPGAVCCCSLCCFPSSSRSSPLASLAARILIAISSLAGRMNDQLQSLEPQYLAVQQMAKPGPHRPLQQVVLLPAREAQSH